MRRGEFTAAMIESAITALGLTAAPTLPARADEIVE